MPSNLIHRLTGKDTRLNGFRHFELLVNVFVVVLLISNLVAQKIVPIKSSPIFARPSMKRAAKRHPCGRKYFWSTIVARERWVRFTASAQGPSNTT